MSELDVEATGKKMLEAAKVVVGDKWPKTKAYFESESKILAQRLASVARLRVDGKISEQRAKDLVAFQLEAFETVLLAVEGLNQLLLEEALNAALKVVKDAVNTAAGFALL
jgi:hypothetical protein